MTDTIREVKLGEVFTVVLQEIASTGYRWEFNSAEHFNLLKIDILTPDLQGRHVPVGGSITMVYSLQGRVPGQYALEFAMRRSWEKNSNPIETYREIIIVLE